MSPQSTSRRLARSIFSLLFLASINFRVAEAQVIPDGTLPTNVEQLENMRKITGGERSGNNLFHSFEEFAIPAGMEVIFENATDIQNIFTRITGSEISLIDGLLQTAGGANFFLINPNGILFGENAQLNVGGSFVATTANSIEFADGTSFAARGNDPNVTLTISIPVGLGFYGNNGSITVNGSGNQITRQGRPGSSPYLRNRTSGLSVPSGETLALIGKGINFNSGAIVTEGGKIELGSVESGQVRVEENSESNGFTLGYEEVQAFEDIDLNQNALIDSSVGDSSSIAVFGQDVALTDNSILLIQNNETKGDGAISVNASALLEIRNQSNITSETLGEGNASPISIFGKNLIIQDSGLVISNTFGSGRGGDIEAVVSEKIELIGSDNRTNPASLSSFSANNGDAGNISISTQELSASQGSSISSASIANGKGGNINIASHLVQLDGTTGENGVFTFIGSITFGQENAEAGNVNFKVANLKIINGAAISSDSSSNAASGNITINATDSIQLIGIEPSQSVPSSITSSITAQENEAVRSALGLPLNPSGNAGEINITTRTLNISEGGAISVRNEGTGSSGALTVNADNLNLDRSGSITAAAESGLGGNISLNTEDLNISNDSKITARAGGEGDGGNITINTSNLTAKKNNEITASANLGEGGNITINADNSLSLNERDSIAALSASADGGNINLTTDQLQLNNNSQISTSAQGRGDGGNITINTDIFTALNNSEVTANAIEGDGGNITINTEGYFVSDDFVISASSEFGLDGTVEINIINEKDVNQGFILPDYPLVSLESILAKSCLTKVGQDKNAIRINVLGKHLPLITSLGMDEGETLMQELEELEELEELSKVYLYSEQESAPDDVLIQAEHIIPTEDGRLLGVAEASIPSRCLH